jgi:hypothetical protein
MRVAVFPSALSDMTILGDDWIQTDARVRGRSSWAVIVGGEVVHQSEVLGDDPSGILAYEAALQWTERHLPDIAFHWRHLLPSGTAVTRPRRTGGTNPV